jgi:hypothetical protein
MKRVVFEPWNGILELQIIHLLTLLSLGMFPGGGMMEVISSYRTGG